ncbi:hypothetical protein [Streptantibioticus ferralitis]|uniref:DUF3419 family protein n=1 Tax=Streptantibioticus ferralitis TaxID=236510 RepID=A0ABT5Z5C3_9ACTN|nr:hypothetical protein [Streptantibioticus ferralitis]MDF2259027.1 hypothetical protein [Streptantibioticus ferralitis]
MTGNPWSAGRILTAQSGGPRLLFGRMYEDPRVELRAFPAAPARVLCIASAGDTAAALAHAGHDVTAIDINARQLGYAAGRVRRGAPARTGTAEHLTAVGRQAAAVLPAWRPASLAAFLDLDDPVRQLTWWRERLDGPGLRLLMGAALRPAGLLAALLRPGFRGAVPARFDTLLRQRIANTVARHPNADNPLLRLLLLGEAAPDPAPTPGVRFVHAEVAEYLESVTPGSYDAITLSNVLDGPGSSYARRLRTAVERAVRPGGVAVLRSLRGPGSTDDRCPLWGTVHLTRIGGMA